jgi:RimJ/RimL family protein N-acetyltransferase
MIITFKPVTAHQIRHYVSWQYEPPYDIYNESVENEADIIAYYLDPQFQAHGMTDEKGRLVGIVSFGPDGRVPGGSYATDALDIGLAIRPDLTGQGKGHIFIEAVIDFALEQFTPPALRVTIAAFNRRAQRVWQKAGFEKVEKFGRYSDNMQFITYIRYPNP